MRKTRRISLQPDIFQAFSSNLKLSTTCRSQFSTLFSGNLNCQVLEVPNVIAETLCPIFAIGNLVAQICRLTTNVLRTLRV